MQRFSRMWGNRAAGLFPRVAPAVVLLLALALPAFASGSRETATKGRISIVAAEDFYGDVAAQIGGERVAVRSILSNPNVDPHEYESTVGDAMGVANARLVIENGGGYDSWMAKLLSSTPSRSRIVINAYEVSPIHLPDNVHVFYSIENMQAIAKAIRDALDKIDPSAAPEFDKNYASFAASLAPVRARMAEIKARYAGAPVALTETVFLYQAEPMGLKVLTPFDFQKAIAEGNDPPASAALTAERQVAGKQVRVLIYNEQTITTITTRLKEEAQAAGIPIVAVTETMSADDHYQSWMSSQLERLQTALAAK